ncbi:MAG TPA: SCP2 sterol-binding domain-containing protein [Acidimicrobiales bacterium]
MPKFLSDDWVAAARKIRSELEAAGELPDLGQPIRLNLDITGVPFGDDPVEAHVDTTDGIDIELGHLDEADAGISLSYDTAQAIFVAGDANAAMQAFMAGQLKVTGDVTRVMGFQAQLQTADFKKLQERFLEITD